MKTYQFTDEIYAKAYKQVREAYEMSQRGDNHISAEVMEVENSEGCTIDISCVIRESKHNVFVDVISFEAWDKEGEEIEADFNAKAFEKYCELELDKSREEMWRA